jgi:hypothetical protein
MMAGEETEGGERSKRTRLNVQPMKIDRAHAPPINPCRWTATGLGMVLGKELISGRN